MCVKSGAIFARSDIETLAQALTRRATVGRLAFTPHFSALSSLHRFFQRPIPQKKFPKS